MFACKHCKFVNVSYKHCYQCKHEKQQNLFFSELDLTKGALIKACFIGTGAALENLPYDLTDYLSIIWASFYWEVARTLRNIVIIIRYIFGQLFFLPCGVTCLAWSKEVPINDGTWRLRYSLYNVCIEVYREILRHAWIFEIFFIGNHTTKHFELFPMCLCMLYCCIVTL